MRNDDRDVETMNMIVFTSKYQGNSDGRYERNE